MRFIPAFLLTGALVMVSAARTLAGDTIYAIDVDGNGSERVRVSGDRSRDPDGSIVDYTWDVNGTTVAFGYGPRIALLDYTFALGTTTVRLFVHDDVLVSSDDVSNVIVLPQGYNNPPVAEAQVPDLVNAYYTPSALVFVDASASHDPENDPITQFGWSEGAITYYVGASATATFALNGLGVHTLKLTVTSTDNFGVQQSGSKNFSVEVASATLDMTKLAGPEWKRTVGTDFSFSNVYEDYAGLTFDPISNTYLMTENQEDVILRIDENGNLLQTINIHEMRKTGELETDAEGITRLYDNTYALVMEGGEEMAIANILPTTTALSRSDVTIFDLFGDPKGVTYKASEDAIYWVSQGPPMRVVKSRINSSTGHLDILFNHDMTGLPVSDLADITHFPQLSPNMFLISQSTPMIMEVDVEGPVPVLLSALSLDKWPIPKPGAMIFNDNSLRLLIVGKHVANTAEDDLSIFMPDDGSSPPAGSPILPPGAPAKSINWIHPGSPSQQAEFYMLLTQAGSGEILIYDQTGRLVHSFRTPEFPPGEYRVPWNLMNGDGSRIVSGIYYFLVKTPTSTSKGKMVVVR